MSEPARELVHDGPRPAFHVLRAFKVAMQTIFECLNRLDVDDTDEFLHIMVDELIRVHDRLSDPVEVEESADDSSGSERHL